MCGDVAGYGCGDIKTLFERAEQGNLKLLEIAEIVDERELAVSYETETAVSPE